MLKFNQKTESDQTDSSPLFMREPTNAVSNSSLLGEEKVSSPAVANAPRTGHKKPTLMGIPFARRNLFGINWDRLHLQRRKFVWTRARKIATVTLAVVSLVTGRWLYANLPPTVMLPPNTPKTLSAPNSQHFYAAATETMSADAATKIEQAHSTIDPGPRTIETLAERRAAVQAAGPTLELLRQGFSYQFQGLQTNWTKEQISPYKLSSPVPNFVMIRTLTRLLAVEASVLAADGKYAGALSSSLDAIRFGQDVGQMPTLIGGMIGTLCQNIGNKEALLYVDRLTASEARQAIPRVARLIESEPTMAQIIEGERFVTNGAFQEYMVPGASSMTNLARSLGNDNFLSMANLMVSHSISAFWYTNQGIVDAYNGYMDRVIQQASLPYQQARFPTEAQQKALPPLVSQMVPNFGRAHTAVTRSRARNRVLLTKLAVQAYRQEHNGAFPKTLNDLTLGPAPCLTTIPSDPFSQTGTDPLRYANGKVYSVGENGKDDLGQGDDQLDLNR